MAASLKNQVVLVIGASSGIGREVALQFAREGARVMASARRLDRLEELRREPPSIHIFAADASVSAQMEGLAKHTQTAVGPVDILVYATGTNTPDRSMRRLTPALWDMMVGVNLNGAYYATQAVLPSMRERGAGHLIYIASVSGLAPDG